MSSIEHQIDKIERIARLKAEELEMEAYNKYNHLFEMAIKFLKTQDVLMYGGYAINDLMTDKDKIYKKYTLPDIDVFTVNSRKVAHRMVVMYKKAGMKLASFSEALHPGTFKVFADGVQVADITGISKAAFTKLSRNSVKGLDTGLRVVDPQFLRLSLHLLLSQANSADRWPKVFPRLNTFYRSYPPKKCTPPKNENTPVEVPDALLSGIYKYLKKSPFVVFGAKEIEDMLRTDVPFFDGSIPWIQIVGDKDVAKVAEDIIDANPEYTLRSSRVYPGDDFVSSHVFLLWKGIKVVAVYSTDVCVTFNKYKGLRVATIHTMLRMYLSMIMSSYRHFENVHDNLECMVNALSVLQQESIGSRKQLLQQLVIECFGTYQSLITLRRERFLRLMQK
jgi:hypothetical protein